METTIGIIGIYWGYMGIMENKMETTIGIIGYILGLYWDTILLL